eukprot:9012216-Prorocentrum_lima.AAC.1
MSTVRTTTSSVACTSLQSYVAWCMPSTVAGCAYMPSGSAVPPMQLPYDLGGCTDPPFRWVCCRTVNVDDVRPDDARFFRL